MILCYEQQTLGYQVRYNQLHAFIDLVHKKLKDKNTHVEIMLDIRRKLPQPQ